MTDFPAIITGGGDLAAFLSANKPAVDAALEDAGALLFRGFDMPDSHSFDAAAERLRPDQMQRIQVAVSEYLGNTPDGQLSDVRFDLALVNDRGQVDIRDGAFSHF